MQEPAKASKSKSKPTLLVVEDDEATRTQLQWALGDDYELCLAEDRTSAVREFQRMRPDVSLLDLRLPPHKDVPSEGLAVLSAIRELDDQAKVIVLSGQADQDTTLLALSQGASDFLPKPVRIDELKHLLLCRSRRSDPGCESTSPAEPPADLLPEALQGRDPRMREVLDHIRKVAATDAPVLILGETGTGKETTARTIHRLSSRKLGPFVAISCGSLTGALSEGELFSGLGGEAVAGTEAGRSVGTRPAAGGTLFLDGVHQLPPPHQSRLLGILQGCAIGRVGEGESGSSTARVIAASSADLQDAAKTGQFLEDLYYSLAVVVIQLPPLRERKKDIRPLARSLLRQFANQHRKPALKFEADALQALERYPWPGNLRELENCLRRSVILADGNQLRAEQLGLTSLPPRLRALHGLKAARRDAERDMIVQALRQHGGKVAAAAAELGVSRPTLYALLRKLRIDRSGASLNEP